MQLFLKFMNTFCCYNLFTQAVSDIHRPMWKTKLFNVPQTVTFYDLRVSSFSVTRSCLSMVHYLLHHY
ncbi:hypothetical protein E2C01_006461 [Portunus trituberculatus]|uniref:Uncharacterized protein n=1 Tax=Portunus trituberculatus TaxID=210409 RepID=A0A5B7CV54_PORTR|nr:hypothetical protein [Portunus trituberculatus]